MERKFSIEVSIEILSLDKCQGKEHRQKSTKEHHWDNESGCWVHS